MSAHLITSPKNGAPSCNASLPHYITPFWLEGLPSRHHPRTTQQTFRWTRVSQFPGVGLFVFTTRHPSASVTIATPSCCTNAKHLWENKDGRDCPKLVMQWLPRNGVHHYDSPALDLRLAQLKNGMEWYVIGASSLTT